MFALVIARRAVARRHLHLAQVQVSNPHYERRLLRAKSVALAMTENLLLPQLLLDLLGLLATLVRFEDSLADAIRLWRDLEQFVVRKVFNRLVQGHTSGRSEADLHIGTRRTDIRQM